MYSLISPSSMSLKQLRAKKAQLDQELDKIAGRYGLWTGAVLGCLENYHPFLVRLREEHLQQFTPLDEEYKEIDHEITRRAKKVDSHSGLPGENTDPVPDHDKLVGHGPDSKEA